MCLLCLRQIVFNVPHYVSHVHQILNANHVLAQLTSSEMFATHNAHQDILITFHRSNALNVMPYAQHVLP